MLLKRPTTSTVQLMLFQHLLFMSMLLMHQPLKAQSRIIPLADNWRCRSSAVTDGTWYEATVPSTVMGVLTTQRGSRCEYPDILEGMNYKHVDASRFRVPWIYERDFALEGLSAREHVSIVFEGIGYSANIRLNGTLVASRDTVRGPFRTYEIDVTRQAREQNTLTVEQFQREMEGVYTTCVSQGTLDESPMAYKGIDAILSQIGPTAEVVRQIKPVYNYKAG
jgi:hypothetical protein